PPQEAVALVLASEQKADKYRGRGIRVLGPPGHAPDMAFTREVIAIERTKILKDELMKVRDTKGMLAVSMKEFNRQLLQRLAMPGGATGCYPVTPRLAESFWMKQDDTRTWGQIFYSLSPRA